MEPVSEEKKVRGKYYSKYNELELQNALNEIANCDLSVGEASKKFNIPLRTLRDRVNGKHNSKHGNSTTLKAGDEKELAEYILNLASLGSPLTKQQILKSAGEIAALDPDETKHFKNNLPSSGWLLGFMKRNPEIAKRTPEALGKASAIHTAEDFLKFFTSVWDYFDKNNILYLLERPELWWNADESGFELNPIPKKVYAAKGTKSVHMIERGNPKANVTATYCVSGTGEMIEPLLTFKSSLSTMTDIAYAAGCKKKLIKKSSEDSNLALFQR
jgi:hypothetical protein